MTKTAEQADVLLPATSWGEHGGVFTCADRGFQRFEKAVEAQYNVKRLRGLIGGLLIVLAPMMLLLNGENTMTATWSFCALVFVLCIVVVILANTWAKKK